MRDAYIVSSVRTPGCKNRRGAFRETRPENLLSHVMKSCVERVGVDPKEIDDCMIGCSFPEGEQGINIGRRLPQRSFRCYRKPFLLFRSGSHCPRFSAC